MLFFILFIITLVVSIILSILLNNKDKKILELKSDNSRLYNRIKYFRDINKDLVYELDRLKHKK